MRTEDMESVIYELVSGFFQGAQVIWAEQVNTTPNLPYVTLKTGGIRRTRFPVIDDDGNRTYPCSTTLEINLYTKGKAVTAADNATSNYSNTAAGDLNDFFNYLDSENIVDALAAHEMDISLEPPVRDLTSLQNDRKYRYRAMAEATVSFSIEANGAYGIYGMDAPNASGGGTLEMAEAEKDIIDEVEINETT